MVTKQKPERQNAPRGHSRAAQNREIRREALREELKAREYIRQLLDIAQRLKPGGKQSYGPEQVPAAKTRAGIYFRLLDKCLPNLRPVDLPVAFDTAGETLTTQGTRILQAVSEGELTPDQGTSLLQGLGTLARLKEMDELESRLSNLEQRLSK